MTFYLLNSLPGKGKTEFALNKIKSEYSTNSNLKALYVVPTKELQLQIKDRLDQMLLIENININVQIVNIDTIDNTETVKSTMIEIMKNIPNLGPTVLIITSATLLNLHNQSYGCFDIVIVDEEIQTVKYEFFNPKEKSFKDIMRIIVTQLMIPKESKHKGYYEITFKECKGDYVESFISKMAVLKDSLQSNKTVLCLKESFDAYVRGDVDYLSFVIVENVLFLQNAKKTYFLGFDLKNSTMVKMYEKLYGTQFKDITPQADLSYDNEIHIHYLSDKDIGNGKLAENEEYKSIIVESYKNHLNQNSLICDFNFTGYDAEKYNFSNVVPVKSHGLNKDDWTMKTDVAIFAHFRHSPEEMKFLSKMGFSKKEADRAREGNIYIQILARSAIRVQGNKLITNIFLIDKRSAEIVKDMLGDSDVTLHKVEPVRDFDEYETNKTVRKNKSNISSKEKYRMNYLRRKKNKGTLTSKDQMELASLILKMGKTPKV